MIAHFELVKELIRTSHCLTVCGCVCVCVCVCNVTLFLRLLPRFVTYAFTQCDKEREAVHVCVLVLNSVLSY